MDSLVTLTGNILVFGLVFGMSATIDTKCFKTQLKNAKAIMTGLILQFLLMPFLGFLVVKTLDLDYVQGLMILIVTCSPGGSYSNWWCSLFNADLALSVTMTAASTLVSVLMLPFNLYVYALLTYEDDVIKQIAWGSMITSIVIVIISIFAGFYASHHYNNHDFNLNANRLGNFAGVALVIFSLIMSNSNSDGHLWNRGWSFYFGVAIPCILGLVIANAATIGLWLPPPERVTVSIECCYQNVGIAMSIAATIFNNADDQAEAMGVPVFYGFVESLIVGLYCVWAWKNGWTKAPTDIGLWKAITTSYEVLALDEADQQHPTGGIQMPTATGKTKPTTTTTSSSTDEGEDWDHVDYGDAGANEPKSNFMDYSEKKSKKSENSEPEKKEKASGVRGWVSFA